MSEKKEFTHFDEAGRAVMVDVSGKNDTLRTAVAAGRILMQDETLRMIAGGKMKKGDVLCVAQVAGIAGAKKTPDLIPMCHPLMLKNVEMDFKLNFDEHCVEITATAKCKGATGVEMEALTAVSVAALTIYDMCKAADKTMIIDLIYLKEKTGGKSGDFKASFL